MPAAGECRGMQKESARVQRIRMRTAAVFAVTSVSPTGEGEAVNLMRIGARVVQVR